MKNINIKIFFYKVLNFFIKKYLSFPTLKFIISTNNNFVKNLYINFWISLSRKKNYFYKFFFKVNNGVNYKINIDIKKKIENLNEECLNILEKNGIIIIENALSENDQSKIIENFNKISIKENRNLRKNETLLKYFEEFDINNFSTLKKISDFFTKNVYGKELNTSAEFHIHQCLKLPEDVEHGDNNMHIDRFLPNMKLYYSPFDINENCAPFCYALGSHKIDNQYINFIKSSKLFSDVDPNAKYFLKDKKEITCKANSLVVALTNGFHGRKPFLEKTTRKVVFLQYHKSYNKISLLFS
jgi:hypothetical protein